MPRSPLIAMLALTLALGPTQAVAQKSSTTPAKPGADSDTAKSPAKPTTTPADSGADSDTAKPGATPVKPPPANTDSKLAVLPLALTGSQDETAGPILSGHLQKGLARGAFAVVDAAEVERLAAGGCSEQRCLSALRKQAGATFVLRSAITVDDRDYVVRLELLATKDGAVLASSEERCDLCGMAEVGALVEAQGALLRRKLEVLIQGPPRLAVVTRPAGALVLVDNELIGKTPLEQNLLDGQHVVRVMLDGYVDDERKVELVPGVRESLEVELRREPKIARYRAAGWATLFTGIPVAAAGIGLLAIDGREIRNRCSGMDRDRMGNCRFVYDTDWGGAFALAAGAALITAGALLLLRTRDRTQSRRPRAFLGPTGVVIVGRF